MTVLLERLRVTCLTAALFMAPLLFWPWARESYRVVKEAALAACLFPALAVWWMSRRPGLDRVPAWYKAVAAGFMAWCVIRIPGTADQTAALARGGEWFLTLASAAAALGLAAREGRRAIDVLLSVTALASLMGLARTAPQLLALRAVQGAVTGTVAASVALISSVVPRAHMGYSLGLMQTAVFSGSSIGPYVGGVVAERFGYRAPFVVTGALLAVGGLLVLFGAKENFVPPAAEERSGLASLQEVMATRGVALLLLVYMLLNLSGSFVGPIFPLFVERLVGHAGRAASQTGLILAVAGVTAALGSALAGRISDRVGHHRMLMLSMTVAGLTCVPQAAARSVWELLVMRAVFGFGAGAMAPAMNALLSTTVPRGALGRAYGLITTAGAIGWSIGPALGGWAASALGLRAPFVIMGGTLVALALLQQQVVRRRAE